MKGFFNKNEFKSQTRPDGRSLSCLTCGLFKKLDNDKVELKGKGRKGLLIIYDLPNKKDIRYKNGFPYSDLFSSILMQNSIDIDEDCYQAYALQCPSKFPTKLHYDCCAKKIRQIIADVQPKITITIGKEALSSVIGDRWKKGIGDIEKWRGNVIPDQDLRGWLAPVMEVNDDSALILKTLFKKDIKNALAYLGKPFWKWKHPEIHYLTSLTTLKKREFSSFSFDYETTGLKPHRKGHHIFCTSIAFNSKEAFVFPMSVKLFYFLELLNNNRIGKRAHNMKFEHSWSKVHLGVEVQNWEWDSMIAAFILNNNTGTTGLKFQTYLNFGVIDYDSEIASYLSSDDPKNGNAINRVSQLWGNTEGQRQLMKYCALDSHFQWLLSEKQMKKLDYKFLPF